MITDPEKKKICEEFWKIDPVLKRRKCSECPLVKDKSVGILCEANSHLDKETGKWEID